MLTISNKQIPHCVRDDGRSDRTQAVGLLQQYDFFGSTLKLPMGATLRANVLVGLIRIDDFHAGAIPIEGLSQLSGDISQEKSFGNQAREFEIATGFCFAAFCSVEPLAFIAGRAGQSFWGRGKSFHFRFGNQFWAGTVKRAENFAAIANEEKTFVAFFAVTFERKIFREFLGARRFESTVIPGESHGGHVGARGKVITNDGSEGVGFVVTIGGTGFNARRSFELQDTKDCVEAVRTHVAESAAAEIAPATPDKWHVGAIKGTFGSRTEPKIPIQTVGHGVGFLG